jgi:hypothetical protein
MNADQVINKIKAHECGSNEKKHELVQSEKIMNVVQVKKA